MCISQLPLDIISLIIYHTVDKRSVATLYFSLVEYRLFLVCKRWLSAIKSPVFLFMLNSSLPFKWRGFKPLSVIEDTEDEEVFDCSGKTRIFKGIWGALTIDKYGSRCSPEICVFSNNHFALQSGRNLMIFFRDIDGEKIEMELDEDLKVLSMCETSLGLAFAFLEKSSGNTLISLLDNGTLRFIIAFDSFLTRDSIIFSPRIAYHGIYYYKTYPLEFVVYKWADQVYEYMLPENIPKNVKSSPLKDISVGKGELDLFLCDNDVLCAYDLLKDQIIWEVEGVKELKGVYHGLVSVRMNENEAILDYFTGRFFIPIEDKIKGITLWENEEGYAIWLKRNN